MLDEPIAMHARLLIDAIVRQTTVLIAQLATSGGVRAPLAHIANQVFLDLAAELDAQGVSRKVSADMFGMALRAYIRKVRRLSEGRTERGKMLWQAVLELIKKEELVTKERVLERFKLDGELEVSAILHDLSESGLVFCSGSGSGAVYRAATDAELGRLSQLSGDRGLDELAWVTVFRHGPLSVAELSEHLSKDPAETQTLVDRLVEAGRVRTDASGMLHAPEFVIPLGSSIGWEASVFDHLQAVVQTICQRLREASERTSPSGVVGGSTYTFDVWEGHPLEGEVKAELGALRARLGALRERVEATNARLGVPPRYEQVVTYVGQCVLGRELPANADGVRDDAS